VPELLLPSVDEVSLGCLMLHVFGRLGFEYICVLWLLVFLQDVTLKLLLDAARGLAYMHDVDVVHGDVKSRNLLVFWEDEEDESNAADSEAATAAAAAAGADADGGGAAAEPAAAAQKIGEEQQQQQSGKQRELVWALKWCDFGVSFRAAEAPDGILRTVSSPFWCLKTR
jgi:serine/threonine protein kinase